MKMPFGMAINSLAEIQYEQHGELKPLILFIYLTIMYTMLCDLTKLALIVSEDHNANTLKRKLQNIINLKNTCVGSLGSFCLH